MFVRYYSLNEQPFGVTPDSRFLYLSPAHREALASLIYGIEASRGFMALIAKPGMGKTTLLFKLLEQFQGSAHSAFLFQTQCTSREFMRFLLLEIGCPSGETQDLVAMHQDFNRYLLQEARVGRRFILVVDEAQNLEPSVLETVRLLSDFETPRAKLLQIILSGQPELADKLAHPSLGQFRQRISILSALSPLPLLEVERYIEHRLHVAGYRGKSMFTSEARKMIAELSEGIPRNINNICFNALSLGCALQQTTIDLEILREVAADSNLASLADESRIAFEPDATTSSALPRASKVMESVDALSAKAKCEEVLSPTEALAYIRKIVDLLHTQQPFLN